MTETKQDATLGDTRMYWLHAQAPLHVGAGRGIGFIDLPIAREVVTNWPFVPGSAVKGVLADHYGVTDDSRKSDKLHYQAFGRADADGESSNSGSLVFTDAHLVCLPVRSLYGTFAWCSSPIALERLKRDLSRSKAGQNLPSLSLPPGANSALQIHVTSATQSVLVEAATQANQLGRAYFEDLDFDAVSCTNADLWATALAEWVFEPGPWRKLFCERFAVVPDDVFSFLCETATQVDARVKIDDDTKTVANGQLWYEESLPPESILAGLAWCGPVFGNDKRDDPRRRGELVKQFCSDPCPLQLGGKATVGRGQVRMSFGSPLISTATTLENGAVV